MYTGDITPTASQGNTKSTIQALLLRNREQRPNANKSLSSTNFAVKDKSLLNIYSSGSDFADSKSATNKLEFDTRNQSSPEHVPSGANQQENLDYQKDFNYSQKLFHIADGNLYSIFSPIQGRSYGMKPSFLRKQKYTVQECHSRGRKNLRKGLKFHNFLPSESVTSEKDNGFLNPKWKVHSECRLREEHGTKQITISNWSQSVQNPDESANYSASKSNSSASLSSSETNPTEHLATSLNENGDAESICKPSTSDPYDFNLCLQQPNSSETTNSLLKINEIRNKAMLNSSTSTKKDSLDFVLNSLMEKPSWSEKKDSYIDDIEVQNKSFQKHRRKPVQTRRIVPYVKYLSIMEENESLPLDLSSKCLIDGTSSYDELLSISGKNDLDNCSLTCDTLDNLNYVSSSESSLMSNVPIEKLAATSSANEMLQTQIATPVTVLYPLPFGKSVSLRQNEFHTVPIQGPSSSKVDVNANYSLGNSVNNSVDKSYNLMSRSLQSNSAFSVQKSFIKEVQSKSRRRNQKSVMKQKLEDTFRQNGFLVKTKQVSDGEATFCKFRQLRKYTRYYLKSLEQHLPDEFHKMWKGFLPPKTVLPPLLGNPEPTNDNAQ